MDIHVDGTIYPSIPIDSDGAWSFEKEVEAILGRVQETEDAPRVTSQMFADGQPRLLNIWASWCLPCIAEAPHLESLKEQGADIVGVAIRDRPEDVARFLAQHGNPYSRIGRDDLSEVQLAIGSSGVPETFVIDGRGVIRYQHIGDIRACHKDRATVG